MPYARLAKLKEEKRTKIMETALDEFLEKNFDSASINQISKKAGLSAGALYYYFEDKEDLFYTTLEYVSLCLMNEVGDLNNILGEHGFWEGIKTFVQRRLKFTITHPRHMKLFHRVLNSNDPVEFEGRERFLQPFSIIFDYGYAHGYIRTDLPKELVFNIHLSMTLAINKWSLDSPLFTEHDLEELGALSEKAVNMIKSAIGKEE